MDYLKNLKKNKKLLENADIFFGKPFGDGIYYLKKQKDFKDKIFRSVA